MYEIYNLNRDAMQAEVDYRRSQLVGLRSSSIAPRARWWRRRETITR